MAKIADGFMASDRTGSYDDVRAILVYQQNRPLLRRYFDSSPEESRDIASVTKSVMSILIGTAIDEGAVDGVDDTLGELLPDYRRVMSPPVAGITLRQVLTMTAGLIPDRNDDAALRSARDWIAAIVSHDLASAPGERFAYSSVGSHLLSAILVEATGQSVLDYARNKLFDPLQIDTEPAAEPLFAKRNVTRYEKASFAWPVDAQGHHTGYGWLKLTPDDMARIGLLMLAGGEWKGTQIVSRQWTAESTQAHVEVTDHFRVSDSYGYQWWITSADGHHSFAASGYGGQLIQVVPDLDLVVVVSTQMTEPTRVSTEPFLTLVDQLIAPAIPD